MAGEQILVVEDEAHIQELLRFYLEGEGFVVSAASTGAEAVEALRAPAPDLVILDVMLPHTDGFEILQRIRAAEEWGPVPVLMLTAKSGEDNVVAAFEAGADDYVTKPFQLESLLARVKRLLRAGGRAGDG